MKKSKVNLPFNSNFGLINKLECLLFRRSLISTWVMIRWRPTFGTFLAEEDTTTALGSGGAVTEMAIKAKMAKRTKNLVIFDDFLKLFFFFFTVF